MPLLWSRDETEISKEQPYDPLGAERDLGFVKKDLRVANASWKELTEGCWAESFYCEACRKVIVSLD